MSITKNKKGVYMAPSEILALIYGSLMVVSAIMWFGFNLKKA